MLGYSFLQIPGLIISIVTQCKGWLSHIRAQGGQTKTKDSTVTMNGKFLESKIKSEKEGTEDWDRNGAFAYTNPSYVELEKRIDCLESYTYGTSK